MDSEHVRSPRSRFRAPRFEAGDTLGLIFATWFTNLPRFFVIALVIYSPMLVAGGLFYSSVLPLDTPEEFQRFLRFQLIQILVSFLVLSRLLTGTITYAVVEQLRGRKAPVLRCLAVAFRRFAYLLTAALAVGLQIFLFVGAAFFAYGAGAPIALFLLIPAIILLLWYFVAEPAALVERPRWLGLGALPRSIQLTRGYRPVIFGLILLLALCMFGIGLAWGLVFRALQGQMTFLAGWYLQQGFTLVIAPLYSVLPAVVYYRLRLVKEGVDADEIAAVFE